MKKLIISTMLAAFLGAGCCSNCKDSCSCCCKKDGGKKVECSKEAPASCSMKKAETEAKKNTP